MKIRSEDTSRANVPESNMYDTTISVDELLLAWRSGDAHPFSAAQKSTMAIGVETNWKRVYSMIRINAQWLPI
jgi:hypothetical protein